VGNIEVELGEGRGKRQEKARQVKEQDCFFQRQKALRSANLTLSDHIFREVIS